VAHAVPALRLPQDEPTAKYRVLGRCAVREHPEKARGRDRHR
jgi:hypothetical protein